VKIDEGFSFVRILPSRGLKTVRSKLKLVESNPEWLEIPSITSSITGWSITR